MKKILILFAALSLVACAKTIEISNGGGQGNPENPSSELTISSLSNPTRAIAEGTEVPHDNFIGLLPNFRSEIETADFDDYNQIRPFGFDESKGVWRGIEASQKKEMKSLISGLQETTYSTHPFYWPGGNRIIMDYVAYSYFNMRDVLFNTAANRYNLGRQLSQYAELIDYVLVANPYIVNPNRMNVWYQNKILNLLTYAMLSQTMGSPTLSPYVLSVVLALAAITDEGVLMPGADSPVNITAYDVLDVLDPLVERLSSDEEMSSEDVEPYLEPLGNKLRTSVNFIKDYFMAVEALEGKTDLIGEEEGQITTARINEVVNDAYELYFKYLPVVGKYIQDDLLYSHNTRLKNTQNGRIDATFNHAKAWVKVVVNNMTDNDIYVSGIAFDNVKTGGTLVIDNSKSAPEVYWDFEIAPELPEYEDVPTEVEFEPYTPTTLQPSTGLAPSPAYIPDVPMQPAVGEAAASALRAKGLKPQGDGFSDLMDGLQEMITNEKFGFIPDTYLVPAHCYGPALSIGNPATEDEDQEIAERESKRRNAQEQARKTLGFTFLNGESTFDKSVAANLSGAMFPSQEPGIINLAYYSWEGTGRARHGRNNTLSLSYPMDKLLSDLNENFSSENLHTVSLNLPRINWEMGKVYIYVITLGNNEITINTELAEWDEKVVTESGEGETIPGGTTPVDVYSPDWQWNN